MPDHVPDQEPAGSPLVPGSPMLRKAPPAWVAAKTAGKGAVPEQPSGDERLVRSYVVTGGRTKATDASELALESLVVLSPGAPASRLQYEKAQIAALCQDVLSVAEIAAHTHLPLGVARVLLADMLAEGYLDVHIPSARSGSRPDAALLEKVLDGLRSV